jgi:hypothetical protein
VKRGAHNPRWAAEPKILVMRLSLYTLQLIRNISRTKLISVDEKGQLQTIRTPGPQTETISVLAKVWVPPQYCIIHAEPNNLFRLLIDNQSSWQLSVQTCQYCVIQFLQLYISTNMKQ